jgi:hypothetical protein
MVISENGQIYLNGQCMGKSKAGQPSVQVAGWQNHWAAGLSMLDNSDKHEVGSDSTGAYSNLKIFTAEFEGMDEIETEVETS